MEKSTPQSKPFTVAPSGTECVGETDIRYSSMERLLSHSVPDLPVGSYTLSFITRFTKSG
ncbi:MAG: hypothetical protein LBG31_02045 [Prevotellaceae bacterium]|nr:hypothetical protein [Prevotellaceae bacterium]